MDGKIEPTFEEMDEAAAAATNFIREALAKRGVAYKDVHTLIVVRAHDTMCIAHEGDTTRTIPDVIDGITRMVEDEPEGLPKLLRLDQPAIQDVKLYKQLRALSESILEGMKKAVLHKLSDSGE